MFLLLTRYHYWSDNIIQDWFEAHLGLAQDLSRVGLEPI